MIWDFFSKDIPVSDRQIGSTTVDPSWHLASAYSKTCSERSRVKFITFHQPSPTSKFLKYLMILGQLSITVYHSDFVWDVRQKSTEEVLLKQWNSMSLIIYNDTLNFLWNSTSKIFSPIKKAAVLALIPISSTHSTTCLFLSIFQLPSTALQKHLGHLLN